VRTTWFLAASRLGSPCFLEHRCPALGFAHAPLCQHFSDGLVPWRTSLPHPTPLETSTRPLCDQKNPTVHEALRRLLTIRSFPSCLRRPRGRGCRCLARSSTPNAPQYARSARSDNDQNHPPNRRGLRSATDWWLVIRGRVIRPGPTQPRARAPFTAYVYPPADKTDPHHLGRTVTHLRSSCRTYLAADCPEQVWLTESFSRAHQASSCLRTASAPPTRASVALDVVSSWQAATKSRLADSVYG